MRIGHLDKWQIELADGGVRLYSRRVRRLAFRPILLFFAAVSAHGENSTPKPAPTPTPDPAVLKALRVVFFRAVGSYNSVDLAGLRRQFSSQAPGLADDGAFRRLFFGYYLENLGRVKSMEFLPADSSADPNNAMLVYEAAFDFWPRVKVSANFTREAGSLKLVQLRFEKVE